MASMGASLETSTAMPFLDCPLCHGKCRQPTTLRCGHSFCNSCIQELWSGSPTGPYYCPECREEYRKLPAFGREAEIPSTSASKRPSTTTDQAEERQATGSASPFSSSLSPRKRRSVQFQQAQSEDEVPACSTAPPPGGSVVACHYCPSGMGRRPAVKSCLVCGASMCAEHLRPHLDAPVFQSHPLVEALADISQWRCEEHQEVKKIYCRQCAACVCTVCTLIGAHRDHTCVSVAEAEKELRGNLKHEMKKMQGDEKGVQNTITKLNENKQRIQDILHCTRTKVQDQYQAMREALEQEELQALQSLSREEGRALSVIEGQLEQHCSALDSVQLALSTFEHLLDTKGKTRIQDQAFIMEHNKIMNSLSGISRPSDNLEPIEVDEKRLEQLQAWTERRLNMILLSMPNRDYLRLAFGIIPRLDQDTAHHKLVLSEENRKVLYNDSPQLYPERESRFRIFPQVLATQPREGGRSYWEVEVRGEGRWKVGVCEARIARKGEDDASRIGFNPHSWCLYGELNKVEALHNKVSIPLSNSPPQIVGVYLDLEGDTLSFYSVSEEGALTPLHTFQHRFTQPLYPALAVSKTQLTFCNLFQAKETAVS